MPRLGGALGAGVLIPARVCRMLFFFESTHNDRARYEGWLRALPEQGARVANAVPLRNLIYPETRQKKRETAAIFLFSSVAPERVTSNKGGESPRGHTSHTRHQGGNLGRSGARPRDSAKRPPPTHTHTCEKQFTETKARLIRNKTHRRHTDRQTSDAPNRRSK